MAGNDSTRHTEKNSAKTAAASDARFSLGDLLGEKLLGLLELPAETRG